MKATSDPRPLDVAGMARGLPIPSDEPAKVFRQWLEATLAGDRERAAELLSVIEYRAAAEDARERAAQQRQPTPKLLEFKR